MKLNLLKIFTIIFFSLLLQQCCTSKDGVKETVNKGKIESKQAKMKKSLPRGVIDLTGEIIKVFEKEKKLYCIAKIEKINGYGGGVRPVAIDNEYEFEIDSKLVEAVKSNINKVINFNVLSMPNGIGQTKLNQYKIISITN